MKEKSTRSNSLRSRTEYKRKFSLREMYLAAVFAPRAIAILNKNKKNKLVDQNLVKRIQLAVTEVNGCALCAYGHAKMALRQGMSNEEINSFLSGVGDDYVKLEESKAILFAQHFAESKGCPQRYTYDSIVNEYGVEKAKIILSAAQMIITGNMYGIPMSAFQSRLKGKPYKGSSLLYEFSILIAGVFILPIAILYGVVRGLVGLPNNRFDTSQDEK